MHQNQWSNSKTADACALDKDIMNQVQQLAESQAHGEANSMFTHMMDLFKVESLPGFQFCLVTIFGLPGVCVCQFLSAKSNVLADLKFFAFFLGKIKRLRPDQ